jgi:hypothetical protein
MKPAGWKDIAELIGIVAIVASLLFVGMELQQQQRMAVNEAGFNLVENGREVTNTIIEHADIWLKGNAGEELERVEAEVYRELIRLDWARAFWTAATQQGVGLDLNVAIHDFAAFLHRNPGARRVWETEMAIEQNYRERLISQPVGVEFMNIVLSDLEQLDSR